MLSRCSCCNKPTPDSGFYKCRKKTCKECVKKSVKKYRKENATYLSDYHKRKYQSNRKAIISRNIAYEAKRIKNDPVFRVRKSVRGRMRIALRKLKTKKFIGFNQYVGCSAVELKDHIESMFTQGMSWANHGKYWHIDHIKPLSSFDLSTPEGQSLANHYTNLQPLTAKENMSKGNR